MPAAKETRATDRGATNSAKKPMKAVVSDAPIPIHGNSRRVEVVFKA